MTDTENRNAQKQYVRPRAGLQVRNHITFEPFREAGAYVDPSSHIARSVQSGDLLRLNSLLVVSVADLPKFLDVLSDADLEALKALEGAAENPRKAFIKEIDNQVKKNNAGGSNA